MLKIFKKGIGLQLTAVVLVSAVMWLGRLMHPIAMPEPTHGAPLYGLAYLLLGGLPRTATILALLLHLATGALLSSMLYDRKMIHSNTLLPMLLYMVTVSVTPAGQTLCPTLFINLVLLWILHLMLATETRFKLTQDHVFGVAALLGVLTLFYVPALTMALPLLIILIFIYKFYNLHDLAILLLGFLAPYILLFTVAFLSESLIPILNSMRDSLTHWELTVVYPDKFSLAAYSALLVMLALSLLFMSGFIGSKTVMHRNNAHIVMLTLVGALLLLPYCQHFSTESHGFAIAFAFSGSLWLTNSRTKQRILNLLLTTWVLLSIVNCILN